MTQRAGASTAARGVEATELEIANTRLDHNTNSSRSSAAEGSAAGGSAAEGSARDSSAQSSPPALDATGSYVQVVVQKQRRPRAACGAQTSPRLPAASSPIRPLTGLAEGAGDGVVLVPASVLLACPPAPRAPHHSLPLYTTLGQRPSTADAATSAHEPRGSGAYAPDANFKHQKIHKASNWKIFNHIPTGKLDSSEEVEPERVEVYYLERSQGAFLATATGARVTAVERAGRRGARAAQALLAEALAAAQLLLALPVALLVSVERCLLTAARDLVTGVVQTAADYALKPALALAFNALAAPALGCAAHAAAAARDALRPLWLAAGDAAEPAARLLAQLSLVQVRVEPRARHHRDVV